MRQSYYEIKVLAEMIEAFDREEPKPGNKTTAFIKRWRAKELEEKHGSSAHLQAAIFGINAAEIQQIRETKKFRDEQREGEQLKAKIREAWRAKRLAKASSL